MNCAKTKKIVFPLISEGVRGLVWRLGETSWHKNVRFFVGVLQKCYFCLIDGFIDFTGQKIL
jgi:hypothetical protein